MSGYADDHVLINSFHPENTEIFSTLGFNISCIQDWMDRNQLKMNGSKTEFIVFGSKHQLQTYTLKSLKIDDTVIMAKSVKKFLGTYLDESLNRKTHIAIRTKNNALYNLHLIKIIYYPGHSKNASMFTGSLTTGPPELISHRFTKSNTRTL